MARTQGSHGDITGPRVRAAALRLFAARGYAAVSMRMIAEAVGVSAGALYAYTPDKQTLLYALMRGHMEALLASVPAAAREGAPRARLRAFVGHHIRYHLDRPDQVFIAYMELRNLTPENFNEIEGLRRRYEDHLEAILRDGRDAGAFDAPDPKLATLAIIAMLTGVTVWFREDGRLSRDGVEEVYWDLVAKAVSA